MSAIRATGNSGELARRSFRSCLCGFAGFLALTVASAFSTSPAIGQDLDNPSPEIEAILERGGSESGALCAVFSSDGSVSGRLPEQSPESVTVYAACNGQGIVLGQADRYEVAIHQRTGVVAVAIQNITGPNLWLLSQDIDGSILRENLTNELARAAGRGPMSGLDDIVIDLSRFERTGTIALAPSGRADARPARAAEISLEDRLPDQGAIDAASSDDAAGDAQ